jgi:hypothetical protein
VAGIGIGIGVGVGVLIRLSSPPSLTPQAVARSGGVNGVSVLQWCSSSRIPPCEQGLTAVAWVGMWVLCWHRLIVTTKLKPKKRKEKIS